jgi:UDP-N-acetylmuramyl tripeptide synthase
MAGGIASELAAAATAGGRRLDGDMGLFEVDEFWLPQLLGELEPRALLLSNLFRDQLDRYGELEAIGGRWLEAAAQLPASTALVLNADDPLIADLGRDREALYFGVEDDSLAQPEMQHAADSKHCRRCGHAYAYEAVYMGHLGRYGCPACGAARPQPAVSATSVELRGLRSAAFTLRTPAGEQRVELPLPGLYNVYNAIGAAALCHQLGAPLSEIVAGLQAVAPAFGRAETIRLSGRDCHLLLIKNPAGANEVLRTLTLEDGRLQLLGVLNDRIADGRDVSWVWDADWESAAPRVERLVCAGTRAAELAVRMKYAGVDPARLAVVEPLEAALEQALASGDGPLYVLPTYTALLELRELLARRGQAREYWRR